MASEESEERDEPAAPTATEGAPAEEETAAAPTEEAAPATAKASSPYRTEDRVDESEYETRKASSRDWWIFGVAAALLLGMMALPRHVPGGLGVLLGFVLTLVAAVGLMGVMGDSPLDLRGTEEERGGGDARPWWRREGSLVLLVTCGLYLPLAGAFGLWDPWETHYSEVAREILARDDWITLWWAQEGWFMSKPILIFWMSALGMGFGSMFGLRYGADAGPNIQEWFIRLPICALAIAAVYAMYKAVSRAWGPRAGALVALVLATSPHWFFLAHQAMTDMPFVGPLTLAVASFTMAVTTDPEARVRARRVTLGRWTLRVSRWHLVMAAVLLVTLPQVAYLLTRPVVFSCPDDANAAQCARMLARNRFAGIQFPIETFFSGSFGNSGPTLRESVPGSPAWERVASATPFFPSFLQGALWSALLAWTLSWLRRERRDEGLHFTMFYLWCAVSTMGKGPAGLAIPGAVALLHYVSTARWNDLRRIRVGTGLGVFLCAGMPWYVAVTGRLGDEFIQRFVVHDLINRTMVGVHGDTGSVRYFLWQLGYALFPWSGLAVAAIVGWRLIVPDDSTRAQRDVARVGLLWFTVAFVLFSAMVTKFHHYILPAVPGAAVMVGLLLDRMMASASDGDEGDGASVLRATLAQAVGLGLAVMGVARSFGSISGRLPSGGAFPPGSPTVGGLLIGLGVAAWFVGWSLSPRCPRKALTIASTGFGAAALGAAAVVAMVTRDLAARGSRPPGSERLIHLFVYNYDRPWPTRFLDYAPVLAGFGVVFVAVLAFAAAPAARAYATRGAVVLAVLFTGWALDGYMIQVTPHWSQRPLFARYYAMRGRSDGSDPRFTHDPIVAHQMNWKGENFYTGNRVVAEECGLKYCTGGTSEFIREHPGQRVFFVTEHSRVQGLMNTIESYGGTGRRVTGEGDNNKFVLVEARLGTRVPGGAGSNAGRRR